VRRLVPILACTAALTGGCDRAYRTTQIDDEIPAANTWLVRTLEDEAVENAIVAQRTIYAYHFVRDSAELTPVGRRDLRVLASYFSKHPGSLSVRRGEESDELYQRRLAAVGDALATHGVDPAAVSRTDDLPRGDGVNSDRAIAIQKAANAPGAGAAAKDTSGDDAQGSSSSEKGANR
jgi:hypothetical protein